MKKFFFAFQIVSDSYFYEVDGEIQAETFKEAKLIADNLGKLTCNEMKSKALFMGSVVSELKLGA